MKQIGAYMNSNSFVKATETKVCTLHGQYVSALIWNREGDKWTGCPICITNKSQQSIRELFANDSRISKQNRINTILKRAAIPPSFENVSFNNYQLAEGIDQEKVFRNCKYFAENFAKAIEKNKHGILVGRHGTGKTHLAISIVRKVLETGYSAVFANMLEIGNSIRDSYKNKNKSESEVLDNFIDIDLLIIDECAVSYKPLELEKLFYIINKRYESKRPTLIISNELKDLEAKVGSRVMSRLQEGGFVQNFNWDDYRVKKARQK